jgi:hypothetical protein
MECTFPSRITRPKAEHCCFIWCIFLLLTVKIRSSDTWPTGGTMKIQTPRRVFNIVILSNASSIAQLVCVKSREAEAGAVYCDILQIVCCMMYSFVEVEIPWLWAWLHLILFLTKKIMTHWSLVEGNQSWRHKINKKVFYLLTIRATVVVHGSWFLLDETRVKLGRACGSRCGNSCTGI